MSGIRCIMYNNVKDQIERTLAHYQRQNKYCRRSPEFLSVKKGGLHSVWIEENSYYNILRVWRYIKDIIETEKITEGIGRHEGHQSKQRFSVTIPTPPHKRGRRVAVLNVALLITGLPQASFLAWQPTVCRFHLRHCCPPPFLDPRLDHHYYHLALP
jgi:hypothetical protein